MCIYNECILLRLITYGKHLNAEKKASRLAKKRDRRDMMSLHILYFQVLLIVVADAWCRCKGKSKLSVFVDYSLFWSETADKVALPLLIFPRFPISFIISIIVSQASHTLALDKSFDMGDTQEGVRVGSWRSACNGVIYRVLSMLLDDRYLFPLLFLSWSIFASSASSEDGAARRVSALLNILCIISLIWFYLVHLGEWFLFDLVYIS